MIINLFVSAQKNPRIDHEIGFTSSPQAWKPMLPAFRKDRKRPNDTENRMIHVQK
jgi:hypothetical protein